MLLLFLKFNSLKSNQLTHHRLNLIVLLLSLLILSGCRTKTSALRIGRIDSVMSRHPEFHGVLMLEREGMSHAAAYGFKDPVRGVGSDTAAIFELASVSKTLTSTVILQLVSEGRLSLEDSLRAFFPELPYPGISIRQMLSHTSGLPDYQAVMDAHWDKNRVAGNEECIGYLSRFHPPVLFKPGSGYAYSNTGYLILASVAEKLTGRPFAALLKDRIFKPAGMSTAAMRTSEDKRVEGNFAYGFIRDSIGSGYAPADSFPSSNYTVWLANRRGPGRVSMKASDLVRFARSFVQSQLLEPTLIAQAFEPAHAASGELFEYGLGWELWNVPMDSSSDPVKWVGHLGDNPGYKTVLLLLPSGDRVMVLLSNNGYPEIERLARELAAIGW